MIHEPSDSYAPYGEDYFERRDTLSRPLLDTLDRFLHSAHARDVLEVGSGTGRLLRALHGRGFRVYGVDRSPVAARLSGGTLGLASQLPFRARALDAVIAVSVIEHFNALEGNRFLTETARILKPGGLLFLVTPNFRSPMRLVLRERWFGYSDPTHICFYTPSSLRSAMVAAGFRNVRVRFSSRCEHLDWPLPGVCHALPPRARVAINKLLIGSPLATLRDSLWLAGQAP